MHKLLAVTGGAAGVDRAGTLGGMVVFVLGTAGRAVEDTVDIVVELGNLDMHDTAADIADMEIVEGIVGTYPQGLEDIVVGIGVSPQLDKADIDLVGIEVRERCNTPEAMEGLEVALVHWL